ncbi:MAG: proprotein convertase P-domain-containing protein [Myxococcota bacterium]
MRFHKLIVMVALLCSAVALLATVATAAVPGTALIEGTLHSSGGGAAADGDYATVFAIYKDQVGGSPIWFEGPVTVKVAAGQFSYALGSGVALKPADLATGAWLGMKIGQDPELARKPLHSVAYALRAAVAEGLSCTGCVGASQLDATALKDYLKAGDLATVALSGAYADLAGAPDLTGFVKAANLADVATTGAYADLTGAPDLTVYAKTAGLAKVATTGKYADLAEIPAMAQLGKSCGSNLVVVGIKADGSLECAQASAAATIAADNIDEISNGLIWNQFTDVFAAAAALPIPDNNPIGGFSEIVVGDVGLAQKLTVSLELTNSDISTVQVWLYDAANQEYVLYNKGGKKGDGIKTAYPDPTTTISGDLTYWVGKNPKGTWRLKVVDTAFLNNTTDGQVVKWSVNLQTLSSKKIQIKGDLIVDGTITNAALDAKIADALKASASRVIRYNYWSSYEQSYGWIGGDNPAMFGGVNPSTWGDGSGRAYQMNFDAEIMRTFFNKKMWVGLNAMVVANTWCNYSSTNSWHTGVMMRIKNTTASAISWTPYFYATGRTDWSEYASLSLNGANNWQSPGNHSSGSTYAVTLSIPANRTSTVIVIAGAHTDSGCFRTNYLAFYNNSLSLPSGLLFVDDLDSATGNLANN